MKPLKLIVKTNTQNYPILIGSNLISKLNNIFKKNSISFKKCFVIIDNQIPKKKIFKIQLGDCENSQNSWFYNLCMN